MKTKIWIALLAVYLVWGSTYLVVRFAVDTLPPRILSAAAIIIGAVIFINRASKSRAGKAAALAVGE